MAHIAPAAPAQPANSVPCIPRPLSGGCAFGFVTKDAGVSHPMPPMCHATSSPPFQSRYAPALPNGVT